MSAGTEIILIINQNLCYIKNDYSLCESVPFSYYILNNSSLVLHHPFHLGTEKDWPEHMRKYMSEDPDPLIYY